MKSYQTKRNGKIIQFNKLPLYKYTCVQVVHGHTRLENKRKIFQDNKTIDLNNENMIPKYFQYFPILFQLSIIPISDHYKGFNVLYTFVWK